jgi:hypothetical protein
MTKFITLAMRVHGERVQHLAKEAAERTKGVTVKLLSGKYQGRLAKIDGVMFDERDNRWLFCCMVLRSDGSGKPLNTDIESRAYRCAEEFTEISSEF